MNRVAVFAHYDKDNLIDDYVVYYLTELKKVCDRIIFVSDCDLIEGEANKLKGLVSAVISGRHGEYDFGSYKRGYLFLNDDLANYDELIFCNDSCYGPFFSLDKMFQEMSQYEGDFWGLTANSMGFRRAWRPFKLKYLHSHGFYHIQSFFIVFKKNVINSSCFYDFIASIKKQEKKNEIIVQYEVGLTAYLQKHGFACESYVPLFKDIGNLTDKRWREIILFKRPFPFVKCSMIRKIEKNNRSEWQEFLKENTSYDCSLITNHIDRIVESN